MSTVAACARAPDAARMPHVSSAAAPFLSKTPTTHPSRASSIAIARPMAPPAPVTMAFFPPSPRMIDTSAGPEVSHTAGASPSPASRRLEEPLRDDLVLDLDRPLEDLEDAGV